MDMNKLDSLIRSYEDVTEAFDNYKKKVINNLYGYVLNVEGQNEGFVNEVVKIIHQEDLFLSCDGYEIIFYPDHEYPEGTILVISQIQALCNKYGVNFDDVWDAAPKL